jgi:hypothetical protein
LLVAVAEAATTMVLVVVEEQADTAPLYQVNLLVVDHPLNQL